MNEKAYKAVGIAAGVSSIISGARLLKEKKGILF